jgi:XTP/dITP diphosphohydrolase
MKLLMASNNSHKHGELREIFAAVSAADGGAAIELVTPREMGIVIDPDETADTYAGNARLKAQAFAQALRQLHAAARDVWVIADDSGLEVDALGGRPGIHSARYHRRAPGGDGSAELLREMQGVPDSQRTARFQCAIVLVAPDGGEYTFAGTCEGHIGHEKRGAGGFGFDPVFVLDGDTRTMAELPPEEKHRVSHRGIATRKAMHFLSSAPPPTLPYPW